MPRESILAVLASAAVVGIGQTGASTQNAVQGRLDAMFPDIPSHRWTFEGLQDLRNEGLFDVGAFVKLYPVYVLRWSHGFGSSRPSARKELAQALILSCQTTMDLSSSVFAAATHGGTVGSGPKPTYDIGKIDFRGPGNPYTIFGKLFDEFSSNVIDLHQDPVELKYRTMQALRSVQQLQASQPRALVRQFPDVPTDHWAAASVLALRQLGVIHGYPGGTFDSP